jgi:hypothetical protein
VITLNDVGWSLLVVLMMALWLFIGTFFYRKPTK